MTTASIILLTAVAVLSYILFKNNDDDKGCKPPKNLIVT